MATLDVVPVYVLRHLASFLDLPSLCALSRTARVGRRAAEDELRTERRACASLARRYPAAYRVLISHPTDDDSSGDSVRGAVLVTRMAALCLRWAVCRATRPCDALLAHMGRVFEVSPTTPRVPPFRHSGVSPRRTVRRWRFDLRDHARGPPCNAAFFGRACAWRGPGVAVPVFLPGETVRVRVPSSPGEYEVDATFFLPGGPLLGFWHQKNGTVAVRLHLQYASAMPPDRARPAWLAFAVDPPPGTDVDALSTDEAALRVYVDHVRARLGIEPRKDPSVARTGGCVL